MLRPYPSWAWQDASDPANLIYVQSMEITDDGVMYILDVGLQNLLTPTIVPGVPKLVLYDMVQDSVVQTFVFPSSVASYTGSFLNDLVVDQQHGMVYISDSLGAGGIVVYNRNTNTARRFTGPSTANNPAVRITINGFTLPAAANTPSDGIALSQDLKTLYYCALQGDTLYSLPTLALQDFSLSTADLNAQVVTLGSKPPSDGMAFSDNGNLYFGNLSGNSVVVWQPGTPLSSQRVLVQDDVEIQWVDTFAFDGQGNLIFTSNRLQLFIFDKMNFTGPSANFRIISTPINGNAYLAK